MTKKIPIHLSNEDEAEANKLIERIGLKGSYGAFPEAVRFSIILANAYLDSVEKLIPDLPPDKIRLLLQTIEKAKKESWIATQTEEMHKKMQKV